jgi:hypothetical protein
MTSYATLCRSLGHNPGCLFYGTEYIFEFPLPSKVGSIAVSCGLPRQLCLVGPQKTLSKNYSNSIVKHP